MRQLIRAIFVFTLLLGLFLVVFVSAQAEDTRRQSSAPVISEIRIDQSGDDNDEYFEIMGTPGSALDGFTYLVIGEGAGGSGVIEAVIPLTGHIIPANGYFAVVEATFTLTGTASFTTSFNFENGDNVTHLLVQGFNGADGDDLDTNDDGTLDVMPWTGVADKIALIEEHNPPSNTEFHYGPPTVGPDGTFVPGHVLRCGSSWLIGTFATDVDDTPGGPNPCPDLAIRISEIRIDQEDEDNDEFFELRGPGAGSLDDYTYLVIGDGADGSGVIEAVVPLTGHVIPPDGLFLAVEATFSLTGTADLTTTFSFENSDNVTHLLVKGFLGNLGDDLDGDDDGTLDTTPWTEIADCVALIETVGSGDEVYCQTQVGPAGTFVPGHVQRCDEGWRVAEFAVGVDDTPGWANACPALPPAPAFGACQDPATLISAAQGSGDDSPLAGTVHTLEGLVVGDFQNPANGLGGFFLQEETADQDADPTTSEGIFIFDNGFGTEVSIGDTVRVQGTVDESFGLTRLSDVISATVCAAGSPTPALTLTLPFSDVAMLEHYEGMLVSLPQTLTVSENFNLGRFGEVHVAAGGRLFNPTNVVTPGADANALQAANDLRRIQLDDGSNLQNPTPLPPYFAADGTLRAGDVTSNVLGVLSFGFGEYEIHPVEPVVFQRMNPRLAKPKPVSGTLRVATMNVLNYFTTLDDSGAICGPSGDLGCRGADNADEFNRQRSKILAALKALDADIIGLVEVENNPSAAIQNLVDGLNGEVGAGSYGFIDTGVIGTDAIKVGLLYRTATVSPSGTFTVLNTSVDPRFLDTKNRPALAQTFAQTGTDELLTVVVNHFKSKGSSCNDVGDPNAGDGQGNCNGTRTNAALALMDWLATDPTGSGDPDFLIIGDLNAYALEDPISAIRAGADDTRGSDDDYTDLIQQFVGPAAYSFIFSGQAGYLDHALASSTLAPQVTGVTEWHINADEPRALDYNDFNQPELFQADPFRSADHDPLLVGLQLLALDNFIYLPYAAR